MKKRNDFIKLFCYVIIFIIVAGLFMTLYMAGFGKVKTKMIFENVPDPTVYFSKNVDANRYEMKNIKGVDIEGGSEDNVADIFKKYTKECDTTGEWPNIVFIGNESWCCTNKDETKRLAINCYPDDNKLSVSLVNLEDK